VWCFVGKWAGGAKLGTCQNNLGSFLLLNPDFFFLRQQKGSARTLFWGGFYDLFFFKLFFNPRGISVGAFSGVENAKMRG
jgi:hypothetical protein